MSVCCTDLIIFSTNTVVSYMIVLSTSVGYSGPHDPPGSCARPPRPRSRWRQGPDRCRCRRPACRYSARSCRSIWRRVRSAPDREAQKPAVGGGAHGDCTEFFRCRHASARGDVELEFQVFRERRRTHTADGRLHVLRLDGGDHLVDRHAEACHALQVQPDPHGIFLRAEQARLSDAGHARQAVDQGDGCEVRQKQFVTRFARGMQRDDLQKGRRLLLDRHAEPLHLRRQLRCRLVDPVHDVDGVEIGVGADFEADGQRVAAVAAGVRLHVDHLVDAVDLAFDDLRRCRLRRPRPRRRDRRP